MTLTRSEFVGPLMRRTWRWYRWWVYPCFGLGFLMLWPVLSPPPGRPPVGISPAIQFFAMGGALLLIAWLVPFLQFRSLPAGKKACTWSFYPDHIEVANATSQGTMQWSNFVKIQETPSAFLFFPQAAMFHVIPKRTVGPDGVRQLRQMSIDALGKRAKVDRTTTSPAARP